MAFGQYGAYQTGGYPQYPQYPQQFQPQQFYPQQSMPMQDQLAQLRSQPMQMQRPQENGMIWVLGAEGAKAYIVAPGTTLPLWDSQAKKIYIKSVDMNGVPTMQTVNYELEGDAPAVPPVGAVAAAGAAAPASAPPADYVTKTDLQNVMSEIEDIWKCIESLPKEHPKPTSRKTEKEARVNE